MESNSEIKSSQRCIGINRWYF